MTRRWKVILVAVAVPVCGYVVLVLLTPVLGNVVGYANEQPALRVVQPPNGWSAESVDRIRRLAKLHFDEQPALKDHYWPEPTVLEERADCWIVKFTAKIPVYGFLWFRQQGPRRVTDMHFTIDKVDYRTRFGIWCQ